MFRNYLKIGWRNLMKNKAFSFINIFGLSVGLVCCMLITFYILNELSYDKFHKNINHLYQVTTMFVKEKDEHPTPNTPSPLAAAMKQEFPEIQETARMMGLFAEDKTLLQYFEANGNARSFYETKGYMADSTFFHLFTYHFLEGDVATALNQPNTIVITEEIAHKMFGSAPALNKMIHVSSNTNGDGDYIVTGVFRPDIAPSHIDGRFFINIYSGRMGQHIRSNTNLANNNMLFTYLLLKTEANAKLLESKFPSFVDKYESKDLKAAGFFKKQHLIPVRDIHLHANMESDVTPTGSVTYLYILASIAIFTLLIACINFMNLSTARSSKRSAEVGVRKVLGAEKKSLIWQFLGESIIMASIAFILAIAITLLITPAFAQVADKQLTFSTTEQLLIWTGFFILALLTGLVAGIYPAFYLSSFKPVKVLKGKFTNSFAAISLRKGLVVFQFIISALLIIASVIISRQMDYLRSTDLGFEKDQQIVIPLRSANAKKIFLTLKSELAANNQIASVGASMYYPGIFNPSDIGLYKEGASMQNAKQTHLNNVDFSFLNTLGIKPIAGRLFSEQFPSDSLHGIIINESAVKEQGFKSPEDAVGKKLYFDWQGKNYYFDITGVVKDFHFQDLHVPIAPYGFELNSNMNDFNYLIVHSKAKQLDQVIATIGSAWHRLNANEPFEYSFLDQEFQKNYNAENRLSAIVGYFTAIAIIISCLGLFGLAAFSAEQRTKEIGVRKVLGASVTSIVTLLSKDFLKLVTIGVLIASPIAWFIMNKWLQSFAYRTSITWAVFVISILGALIVAIITISFQAIRSATANPVKNLRTE